MNDKLVRHLTRLQSDSEDSIRTNVIIFLAKMAGKLKPSTKEKILLSAFSRGIKDRFPAARLVLQQQRQQPNHILFLFNLTNVRVPVTILTLTTVL